MNEKLWVGRRKMTEMLFREIRATINRILRQHRIKGPVRSYDILADLVVAEHRPGKTWRHPSKIAFNRADVLATIDRLIKTERLTVECGQICQRLPPQPRSMTLSPRQREAYGKAEAMRAELGRVVWAELGRQMGITGQRVKQLYDVALYKIRRYGCAK